MPFGGDCEFKDFDACVRAHHGKDNPKAYCAELMRATEEHCKGKSVPLTPERLVEMLNLGNGMRAQPAQPGRQPWTWDAAQKVYRDADGNLLTDRDVRNFLTRFLLQQQTRAAQLTEQLTSDRPEITLPEWENDMRWIIKDSVGASYLLGRGGRNQMDSQDWGRMGRIAARQYGFLNQFTSQLAAGSVTPAQAIARSRMYPSSAKQAQSRGWARAQGAPELPAYPGDGSTTCYGNCLCSWELGQTTLADGTPAWNAYWRDQRGPDECSDCERRGREWNPFVIPV